MDLQEMENHQFCGNMIDELKWPSLETRREQSSGIVSHAYRDALKILLSQDYSYVIKPPSGALIQDH